MVYDYRSQNYGKEPPKPDISEYQFAAYLSNFALVLLRSPERPLDGRRKAALENARSLNPNA